MNKIYEEIKSKALSAMRGLAKECPSFEDAKMLIASSETTVNLKRNKVHKRIDSEWVERIEAALPYIDTIVRNPSVMIEDVDEILPVEISRHITEKSIKHLAQHTNLILDVKGDEVTPSKILNVYHDETLLTYENKFVNTLIARLAAFVDKRYKALKGGSGTEANYRFDYQTEFEHFTSSDEGRNSARVKLQIELTSPMGLEETEADLELNDAYKALLERVKRLSNAITSFQSSAFIQSLKRNYIRPPVIRTNAILKNKNMKECLNLWEFIESFDKVGYSFVGDEYKEMPSDDYITSLHPSVALQYTTFYHGVVENEEENRLLSEKHLFETFPEFDDELNLEELEDYLVYDSEYKKTVPVSRLMNNRKKLSEDEKRIHTAIIVSLKADEILNAEKVRQEAEARRLAREARLREEEERRRREEEEKARRKAELEALRQTVEIRYRRSYVSRLIQAGDLLQGFYTDIKNELLSYKGVKARTSWSKETFKRGRQPVARIDIKGKMLYLYLALDPSLCDERYRVVDCSSKRGGDEYPSLLKVRSERGKKYAFELIKLLMETLALPRIEREAEDFRLPYEDDDALIERGLIKIVLPAGVTLDENTDIVKKDINDLFDGREDGEEKTETEQTEAGEEAFAPEEVTEESSADESTDGEEPEDSLTVTTKDGVRIEVRYRRSFTSRLIQSGDVLKEYYALIKNELLSYKGIKSRMSWPRETFRRGRAPIARIDIRGKTLRLFLALSPDEVAEKYFAQDVSDKSYGADFPTLLKVRSDRGARYAIELITQLCEKLALSKIERAAEDYTMAYEPDEPLIERGLIKVVLPKGVSDVDGAETVPADLSSIINASAEGETIESSTELVEAAEDAIEAGAEAEDFVSDGDAAADTAREDTDKEYEGAVEAAVAGIVEEEVLERKLDEILTSDTDNQWMSILTVLGSPVVTRKKVAATSEMSHAFSDSKHAATASVVIPYTRAQYLALPRKKKKSVLTAVRKMVDYSTTRKLLDALRLRGSQNPRILERIERLEARLAEEARFLPTAKLWEESVKRLKK